MQNISKTSNNFKDFVLDKRRYFASDSTKATLPSLVDYRADAGVDDTMEYEDSRSEYERGYAEGFSDAREIYDCDEN